MVLFLLTMFSLHTCGLELSFEEIGALRKQLCAVDGLTAEMRDDVQVLLTSSSTKQRPWLEILR